MPPKDPPEQDSGNDRWIKCISTHGNLRGVAVQATGVVQEISRRHKNEGATARGLGEALVAGILVASYCKAGERINLNIRGSGLIKQALVDGHPDGTVRGYIVEGLGLPSATDQPVGPWGSGLMSVLRTRHSEGKQPYIGTVPLVTGHLAKDLTYYWLQSEQIPSAVGIVVNIEEGKVTGAGGFLVQAMPGASDAEIKAIDRHIQELESLAQSFASGGDPIDVPLQILSGIFQSTPFMILEEKALKFRCDCSWERVQRSLALIGLEELKSMLDDENVVIVKCDFCSEEYEVGKPQLSSMIEQASRKA